MARTKKVTPKPRTANGPSHKSSTKRGQSFFPPSTLNSKNPMVISKLTKLISCRKVSLLDTRCSLIPKSDSKSSVRVKTTISLISVGNNFLEQRQRQRNHKKTHKRALIGLPLHNISWLDSSFIHSKNFKHLRSRYHKRFLAWEKEAQLKRMTPESIEKQHPLFFNGDSSLRNIRGLPPNSTVPP